MKSLLQPKLHIMPCKDGLLARANLNSIRSHDSGTIAVSTGTWAYKDSPKGYEASITFRDCGEGIVCLNFDVTVGGIEQVNERLNKINIIRSALDLIEKQVRRGLE